MKTLVALALLVASACGHAPATRPVQRPSILLVTLDTTRFDSIGPDAKDVQTPAFNALTARGRRYLQAYAAVPETLPSHSSLMTGLYPGGHGVHENARYLPATLPVVAEQLHQAGYRTSAFVSSFILARRFGLSRGFDVYDDTLPSGSNERLSRATTDAAVADLAQSSDKPRFVWVHYYDAHAPYEPPEPYRTQYRAHPYLGEIAAMDEQLGRLVQAFQQRANGPIAVIVVADHGEGLGEHGEAQHGSLLYQATMHVPLVVIGPGVPVESVDIAVSTRRVYHTILDFAGIGSARSLRPTSGDRGQTSDSAEVVLGEAMKPFLEYGWQPQVMAIRGHFKAILSGRVETYDVAADPAEAHDLGSGAALPPGMRKALEDYPVPSPASARAADTLDEDAKRRLASLGYVSSGAAPVVRKDAPRPADMTAMMDVIERASGLFADGRYKECLPLFERVLAADPHNIDAALRLASAHSALGENAKAIEMFHRAEAIDPNSEDVRTYLGLHYVRVKDWDRAAALLEQVVKESPDRATAVDALAGVKAEQGARAMDAGKTADAIADFERARALQPSTFTHDLELGVLYLADHRFDNARAALDRFLATHPDDPMALFKRAQVSVLLNEADKNARIDLARRKADQTTRALIERERLFR
ncbi:MAG TPA: sulfatase-like hydrolase/transferase [Vicinamibacterales bacterium]|nr:sulfatase-like hydrolase/transferase [Vicinamibacterales bacterium]